MVGEMGMAGSLLIFPSLSHFYASSVPFLARLRVYVVNRGGPLGQA
jgi:hypothetical protein